MDEESAIKADIKEKIIRAIKELDYKEQLVLQLIFYEELPAKEVAKILKISTARVSQIKESALNKLRRILKDIL